LKDPGKCSRLNRITNRLEAETGAIAFFAAPECRTRIDNGTNPMDIAFQKMHGTLNDFVVFHDLEERVALTPEQVARICDRRAGIGGDGLIVVRPSATADFFMDYRNADGSLAEMCGNGIRCLAKYIYDNGLSKKTTLNVETRGGVKTLELFPDASGKIDRVRVDMGLPIFDPEKIPTKIAGAQGPILDYPVEARGKTFSAAILSMGNPHCVIFVDEDPDILPRRYGASIELNPIFPARSNVEFIRVVSPEHLIMRVWERGSGETFSCGTGACAAAVAANLRGLAQGTVTVSLLGGELDITWKGIDFPVVMTGSAVTVYNGIVTI